MSLHYRLTHEEWLQAVHELSASQKDVLFYIRTLDPFGDRDLDLGVREVARELHCSASTVSRALTVLKEKGYIDMTVVRVRVRIRRSPPDAAVLRQDNSVASAQQSMHQCNSQCTSATENAPVQQKMHQCNNQPPEPLQEEGSRTPHTLKTLKTDQTFLNSAAPAQETAIAAEVEIVSEPQPEEICDREWVPSSLTTQPIGVRQDSFSAAPPPPVENWREFYAQNHRPPWRLQDGSFHPLIVQAVLESGGNSIKSGSIYELPNGRPNLPNINKMLRRRDTAAQFADYSPKCEETLQLQDLWEQVISSYYDPPVQLSEADRKGLAMYEHILRAIS